MAYNKVTPLSFSDYCDPYFMVVTSSSLSCTGSAEISPSGTFLITMLGSKDGF